MQPKLPPDLRAELSFNGLSAQCYQPVSLFRGKRKLPNVPEPSDPWECFLRREGEFGVVGRGVGATLRDAVEIALRFRKGQGLLAAMNMLGDQLDLLTEAIHACQD